MPAEFSPLSINHAAPPERGAIQIRRFELASETGDGTADSATELSILVQAAREAARQLELPLGELVWRLPASILPVLAESAGASAVVAARDGQPRRVELKLTIESPPQPSRDVAVEVDLGQPVAELVGALSLRLGLEVGADTSAFHQRRQVWLRLDQSIRAARLRGGDRVLIGTRSSRSSGAGLALVAAIPDGRLETEATSAAHRLS
jgi:hypothetical protein